MEFIMLEMVGVRVRGRPRTLFRDTYSHSFGARPPITSETTPLPRITRPASPAECMQRKRRKGWPPENIPLLQVIYLS